MSDRSFGILYFLDENPSFRAMADISLQSLRRFHPDVPVEIVKVPSATTPLWKHAYRALSFWKWEARRRRQGQNTQVIAEKAKVMLETPFETTLYIDVDTVVLNPLHDLIEQARSKDVVITALPWKSFKREHDWQPREWPFLMAGILFYSRRFRDIYARYVDQVGDTLYDLPLTDLNLLSMTCHLEKENLDILFDQKLQLDHCNLSQLLDTDDYARTGPCIDLRDPRIREFAFFHYNDFKPQYMEQIAEVWGLRSPHAPPRARRLQTEATG